MELLKKIESMVREAGKIVLSAHDIENCTSLKTSAADMVTAYDVKVENFLKDKLPKLVENSVFFGEEEKENADPGKGWVFVVDPIDGTANFVRGFRQSAVSVALAKDGQVEYAVVLDPYKNEMFTAKRGCGAFLNGEPIHVSDKPFSQGIFALGSSPYRKDLHEKTMKVASQLFERSCDFRRMGAAALDLCAIAAGKLEAYFELELSPWDYAAGSLIVTEAGGKVLTFDNVPPVLTKKCSIWASNALSASVLEELEL